MGDLGDMALPKNTPRPIIDRIGTAHGSHGGSGGEVLNEESVEGKLVGGQVRGAARSVPRAFFLSTIDGGGIQ